jgi:hypothetical protein
MIHTKNVSTFIASGNSQKRSVHSQCTFFEFPGTHLYNLQLKYGDYKELTALRAMPHDPNQIVVVDEFKGNILDLKRKTLVRSVNRWNGMAMKTGKHGLFAVSRGGLPPSGVHDITFTSACAL